MRVEVRLFATLREERFARDALELTNGATVADVLRQLRLTSHDVAILLVNGRQKAADEPLRDGDVVSMFPGLGGG